MCRGTRCWWWTRPDRMLQLVPSSRFTKQPELIAPYKVTTPLWPAHTIVIDPKQPRTEEANGTEAAHPFVSVVGAAWLLMGQPGVTETRAIADSPTPRPGGRRGPGCRAGTKGHHRRTTPPSPASQRHTGWDLGSAVQPAVVGRRALAPASVRTQPH